MNKSIYIFLGILLSILFYIILNKRQNLIINESKCSYSNKSCY